MPTKIFTTISGPCPFGKNVTIDSPGCRTCEHFYRTGTGMFFWCNNPGESVPKKPGTVRKTRETVPKSAESVPKTKKRGRPDVKAKKKPVKTRKKKNG